MTIEQAIYERVAGLAPVVAIASTRVYQLKLPQKPTLPAVRVQLVDDVRDQHLRGPLGLTMTRIQVDAYAAEVGDGYTTVGNLADAIHGDGLGDSASGLFGFIGEIGGSPPEIYVANVEADTRRVLYEAGELRLIRMQQDYKVHWRFVN